MAWPGGKGGSGTYQRLINQIPPHAVYLAPFLGDDAILRHKRPADVSIGIDLDDAAIALWRESDIPGLTVLQCDGIEWLRIMFGFYVVHSWPSTRNPAAQLATQDQTAWPAVPLNAAAGPGRQQAAAVAGNPWTAMPLAALPLVAVPLGRRLEVTPPDHTASAAAAYSGDAADAPDVAAVDRPSPISPEPAAAAQSGGAGLDWHPQLFAYIDPPYPRSVRKRPDRLYRHEMTDQQHTALLQTIVRLPFPVMVSSYWSELYSEALAGWRAMQFEVMTRGGSLAEEWAWMNYAEPAQLHDYQYLGDDRRERERIARRRANWANGLQRMPELERRAVLAAIQESIE